MRTREFEELRDLALSKRLGGLLTFDYRNISTPAPSPAGAADAMAAWHGFRPLHNKWRIIQRDQAQSTVHQILFCDLAYGRPLMEMKTAQFIAESFLALFSPHNSCYCTNGFFSERNMLTWTPITQSSFDHGVIAFDEKHIGMIWAQDED